MKKFLFLFIFSFQLLHSQNIENVDKFIFSYSIGHSSWDKIGKYSTTEVLELIKTVKGDYKISKFLKINSIRKSKDLFINDTIKFNIKSHKLIQKKLIDSLIIEINTNKENYNESFIASNISKPTKKEIFEIAKKIDCKDYFINDYDEKEDIKQKYTDIQNFKYLSEFIDIDKPDINSERITMDIWNNLRITTFLKESTKIYDFNFLYNYGQPISNNLVEFDKMGKIKIIENTNNQIINLRANQRLQNVIPSNTILCGTLDLKILRDNYINWFLKHK
jgi:hypothetical protein